MTLPKNLDIRRIDVLCGLATEREGMTPSWPVGRTEGETEVPLDMQTHYSEGNKTV